MPQRFGIVWHRSKVEIPRSLWGFAKSRRRRAFLKGLETTLPSGAPTTLAEGREIVKRPDSKG